MKTFFSCLALSLLHALALADGSVAAPPPANGPAPLTLNIAAVPEFIEMRATQATLALLREGGFALYLRHGLTDASRPDRFPQVDLADCQTQRLLSAEGRALAAQVGRAIRSAGIPIGDIHISPLCRVKDTATAAFPGQPVEVDLNLMYTGNLTDAQKAPVVARTRHWLSAPVAPGSNRLVIAHGPNLMDAMGYFPKETTLVVLRPRGEQGFDYVASIPADLWPQLLPAGAWR